MDHTHAPLVSVLVCTYNRAADLRELLESALAQRTDGSFDYEVVVVDNNSSDRTRAVVESFIARGHHHLRYLFEPRQGRSNALNTGLREVRGTIYALADDDLILPPDYVARVVRTFRAHPEVSFVGGKVLPLWRGEVPAWLTPCHWSAIAMADYGDRPFHSDRSRRVNLLAGAFRVADVRAVGGYHAELGVSKRRIGGTEDVDLHTRLWDAGHRGLYVPTLHLHHKVEPERLTKRYHRRWHTGHGRQYAVMRDPDFERSSARPLGVPAHVYRQGAVELSLWLRHLLGGDAGRAFGHETRLRFLIGFARQRAADRLRAGAERLALRASGLLPSTRASAREPAPRPGGDALFHSPQTPR